MARVVLLAEVVMMVDEQPLGQEGLHTNCAHEVGGRLADLRVAEGWGGFRVEEGEVSSVVAGE